MSWARGCNTCGVCAPLANRLLELGGGCAATGYQTSTKQPPPVEVEDWRVVASIRVIVCGAALCICDDDPWQLVTCLCVTVDLYTPLCLKLSSRRLCSKRLATEHALSPVPDHNMWGATSPQPPGYFRVRTVGLVHISCTHTCGEPPPRNKFCIDVALSVLATHVSSTGLQKKVSEQNTWTDAVSQGGFCVTCVTMSSSSKWGARRCNAT